MKCKMIYMRQFMLIDPVDPLWGTGPKKLTQKTKNKENN